MVSKIKDKRLLQTCRAVLLISVVALFNSACQHGFDKRVRKDHYAGSFFGDPTTDHPIRVAKDKLAISVPVRRHDEKLAPAKLNEVRTFLHYYREGGVGDIKVTLPSHSRHQYAVRKVLKDIQRQMENLSIGPEIVSVKRYSGRGDRHPVIHLSYKRYVAHGPECGQWNENFNESENNRNSPDWGCARQRNLAAMVANPRDLQGPRGWSPRDSRRRDVVWDKYVKGEVSSAARSKDERVDTKSDK
ncbi:MAG: CpaD family pilus assembly protein [Rhizobiales bacterium]|nr:CpaD family pilus assembly protein [Hyphomicrobiales bacterium]